MVLSSEAFFFRDLGTAFGSLGFRGFLVFGASVLVAELPSAALEGRG